MNAEKSEVVVSGRGDGPVNGNIQDARGKQLAQKQEFKYLGSVICSKGGCTEAVKDWMEVAWCKWREFTGVTCDRKISLKLKAKVYKTMIRPALLYGQKRGQSGAKEESMLERTEMRMVRWMTRVSLRDKIKSEEIRRWCAEDIRKSQRSKNGMVWTRSKKGSKGGHQSGL